MNLTMYFVLVNVQNLYINNALTYYHVETICKIFQQLSKKKKNSTENDRIRIENKRLQDLLWGN